VCPLNQGKIIDPFGTLIVTGASTDIVMRKISSKDNTIEVLRDGQSVVYNMPKPRSQWVIYTVPILIVVIVVAVIIWRVKRKKRLLVPESK
jgi:cytochrome c-type biogenesis protein CcmH/NrfF